MLTNLLFYQCKAPRLLFTIKVQYLGHIKLIYIQHALFWSKYFNYIKYALFGSYMFQLCPGCNILVTIFLQYSISHSWVTYDLNIIQCATRLSPRFLLNSRYNLLVTYVFALFKVESFGH